MAFCVLWKLFRASIGRCKRFITNPLFVYTIFWTTILAAVVTVASVNPEFAFTSTLSSLTDYSMACQGVGKNSLRVPLDKPGDVICVPAHLFKKSSVDFIIPPIFAVLVVVVSAIFVHAIGLWEM